MKKPIARNNRKPPVEAAPAIGPVCDLGDGAGDDEPDVEIEGNCVEGEIVAVIVGEKVEAAKMSCESKVGYDRNSPTCSCRSFCSGSLPIASIPRIPALQIR